MVYVYRASRSVFAINNPQFAIKFFDALRAHLGVNHCLTTAYYSQTIEQTPMFDHTLVKRVLHYVE